MKLTDFLSDVGRPVAYYPSLTKITGGVTSTLFLCQLLYWRGKGVDSEGWIYKTQEELTEETGLSRREQESARKSLIEKGLLEEHYARLDHKLFYRLNLEQLNNLWDSTIPNVTVPPVVAFGNGGNVHSAMAESAIRDVRKPPFVPYTETTPETTPESTKSTAVPSEPFEVIELPKWLDKTLWDAFLKMRRKSKAIPTEEAIGLLLRTLADLRAKGDDPNKALEQSIMNNWKGIFPVKNGSANGVRKGSPNGDERNYAITEDDPTSLDYYTRAARAKRKALAGEQPN